MSLQNPSLPTPLHRKLTPGTGTSFNHSGNMKNMQSMDHPLCDSPSSGPAPIIAEQQSLAPNLQTNSLCDNIIVSHPPMVPTSTAPLPNTIATLDSAAIYLTHILK